MMASWPPGYRGKRRSRWPLSGTATVALGVIGAWTLLLLLLRLIGR
jgi:hypothetical protein